MALIREGRRISCSMFHVLFNSGMTYADMQGHLRAVDINGA
jgi:hypothetical protein